MTMRRAWIAGSAAIALAVGAGLTLFGSGLLAQGPGDTQPPPVELTLRGGFDVPPADAQTKAIVAAAEAFLATLSDEQRDATVYDFADNAQRSTWSNFPEGLVVRGGIKRGDMTEDQLAALDALLATVLSEDGVRNVALQLAADDALAAEQASGGGGDDGGPGPGNLIFGSNYYYVSFLGEPSLSGPWMLQFGGHHLAHNVTVHGADVSFAPMLTGGQPLRLNFEDQEVFITEVETAAAQALMDSLSEEQKAQAVRGSEPINLLLGPGEDGTVIAPEGIKGSELTDEQKALLLAVIEARLGFLNADDFAAKMAEVEAGIDDTYFGWWGPEGTLGAAYFRVTGPNLLQEYSPQDMGGDPTEHAHNMYRDPTNDYGAEWIGAE